jgi:hypothetical protein
VKNNFEAGNRTRVTQLRCNYFVETTVCIYVKRVHATLQMHGKDQPQQPKIMIAVQVTDENVINTVKVSLVPHELHLGAFTAVNEE